MKILSYLLSPIFALVFFLILLIFHPIQWLGLKLFGYRGHKFVVDYMNWLLTKSLLILGVPVFLKQEYAIPENETIIFVSNHQSMFEISPISWFFRKHHPKFVSKIELGKGIPSISFNLNNGGAALIDRKDARQAISEIITFSKRINKNKWSAAIFPEGTRSKTGKPKVFSINGLKTITKFNSGAFIVPLTVNNSWKVYKYGKFPLGLGSPITISAHKPIQVNSVPFEQLIATVEETIKNHIKI